MNLTRLFALALLLLATAPAAGQGPATRPTYEGVDAEVALAGIVAAPRLVRAVRALCESSDPAAWAWIAQRVGELGIPQSQATGGPRGDSVKGGGGCSIVVEGSRHVLESAWPLLCVTSGMGAVGPLLPVTASDLEGACAWIPRRADSPPLHREALAALAERGAVGALIGYDAQDSEPFPGAPLWTVEGEGSSRPGIPVITIGPGDTEIVARALASGAPVSATLMAASTWSQQPSRQLLCRIPGKGDGSLVLVTACWTPGRGGPAATARASGVAALLEVARILQLTIKAGEIEPLPFDVLFAIWGHEEGLGEWIAAHPEQAEGLALCIHLERLGPGRPPGTLFLDHIGSGPEERLVARARTILKSYCERKGFWPRFEIIGEDAPAARIPWRRRPLPPAPCLTLSTAPADPPWARGTAAAKGAGPVPGFGPQLLTGWDHPDHLDPRALAFGLEAGTRAALVLIARCATEGLE